VGSVCVGRLVLTIAIIDGINPIHAATEDMWGLEAAAAKWKYY